MVPVTTNRPLVKATADLADLDAIASPLELARRIGEFSRRFGTLPKHLATRRREAIVAASKSAPLVDIAEFLSLSPGRISQLTKRSTLATTSPEATS
jgi:hypothetical protein